MHLVYIVYKMVGWFDGQDIGVEPRKPRFNPFSNIYYVEYVYLYMHFVHVHKYIVPRSVVDR
jgi:hypothetical protein